MHDAVALERLAVPTAVIITGEFLTEALLQRDTLGMRDLSPAVISHPLSTLTDVEIAARADEAVSQVSAIWLGTASADNLSDGVGCAAPPSP